MPDAKALKELKSEKPDPNDDWKLTFEELAQNQGLLAERFHVNTSDGYILTVFHMFSPDSIKNGPVVFMQHGLYSSSDNWIMNEEFSAGF